MAIEIIYITEVMVGLIIRRDTTTGATVLIITKVRSNIKDMIDMVPDTIDSQGLLIRNIEGNYLIVLVVHF
ncbi:MAG: hypothetical protein KAI77_09850, partial [Gammaproteobacteria bacterium]|nr:hypothetical protein [Gammaproteobacteria bacterium]